MRKALLPVLLLALACGEGNPLQPEGQLALTGERAAAMNAASDKWAFEAQVHTPVLLYQSDPKTTPSGIMHVAEVVYEWQMEGDITGTWTFIGKFHVNTKSGKGRSIASTALVDITASEIGKVGTFECVGNSAKIEGFGDFTGMIQYGGSNGCHGSGDFEGMRMRSFMTNVDNPGMGGPGTIYHFTGDIW